MTKQAQRKESSTLVASGSKVIRLPGVNLDLDVGKEVLVRVDSVDQAYKGKIIGFDPYEFIIANVRMPSMVRRDLAHGGRITLKYLHEGTVYGFRTYVLNLITSPTSLVFFEYPDSIEKIELRSGSRVDVSIDGAIHAADGEYECRVINVSETGCKFSARAGQRDLLSKVCKNDTLMVVINFGIEGTLKLPVSVRNLSRAKGIVTMGAMFIDIEKAEEEVIRTYLERHLRLTR